MGLVSPALGRGCLHRVDPEVDTVAPIDLVRVVCEPVVHHDGPRSPPMDSGADSPLRAIEPRGTGTEACLVHITVTAGKHEHPVTLMRNVRGPDIVFGPDFIVIVRRVHMDNRTPLAQIGLAGRGTRHLSRFLQSGHQYTHQHGDHGNDNQQLDEGKSRAYLSVPL